MIRWEVSGTRVRSLADSTIVYRSPDATRIWCYTPAILRTSSGRLLVTFDLGGPGVVSLDEQRTSSTRRQGIGLILSSDDDGSTWQTKSNFAFWHARSEEHTSELQSLRHLVCRLLLE